MIRIKLEMLGPVAESGSTEHELPQGTRLFDWLIEYLKTQPERLQSWLLQGNRLASSVLVVLNNEQVSPETNPQLSDEDEVLLLPPISGG